MTWIWGKELTMKPTRHPLRDMFPVMLSLVYDSGNKGFEKMVGSIGSRCLVRILECVSDVDTRGNW